MSAFQAIACRHLHATIPTVALLHRVAVDQTDLLGTIHLPALVLVGDGDVITPSAVATMMKQAMGNASMTIIKGAGHATPIEQPSHVNRAIREYLQSLDKA